MQKLSRTRFTLIAVLLAMPTGVYAHVWACEHNSLIREVKIEHPATGELAPCSVVYHKVTEGFESQVLWTASYDGAYCEEKADGLVEKLKGWGWVCTEK